jgi:cobalt/nickel transport system ATP-binding protein
VVSEPVLKLDRVSITRAGRPVVRDVSLSLSLGERVGLVGDNGAGKTTLLRALVGLEPLAAGRLIAFGKTPTTENEFAGVRARAGFVFQDPDDQLVAPTVIEDVMFGPLNLGTALPAAEATARATLARLNLSALADRVTHHLSGGEKRLVALAGVLAMAPEVLLLDEPTNALDATARTRLIEVLATLDQAMLIVSHDLGFLARVTTRIVALEGGHLWPATLHQHAAVHPHVHIDRRPAEPGSAAD